MNTDKVYHVVRSKDRIRADWLTDFSFPWTSNIPPSTRFRAWHDDTCLYFEFRAQDQDLVLDQSPDKIDKVLGSDRVELFFSPTRDLSKPYYGFEMDPRGLLYDYRAEFYRKFEPSWTLPAFEVQSEIWSDGYQVEGRVPMDALRALECLVGNRMITGVYRGEFSHEEDGSITQDWISWVDPGCPSPDFHVPESFGIFSFE